MKQEQWPPRSADSVPFEKYEQLQEKKIKNIYETVKHIDCLRFIKLYHSRYT